MMGTTKADKFCPAASTRTLRALVFLIMFGLTVAGCSDEECGDRSRCPDLALAPGENDGEVRWDEVASMVIELGGQRVSRTLEGGGAVFTPFDTQCVSECRITLRALVFDFGRVVLESDDYDDVVIDGLRIGLDTSAPIELSDEGGGYLIPEGTPIQTCASIDGKQVRDRSELDAPAALDIDPLTSVFLVNGEFPFRVSALVQGECAEFTMRAVGQVSAESPWIENPLCAGLESCGLEAPEP